MATTSRIKKKGKIKKVVSEWEHFWDQNPGYLAPPSSWHESRIELLHIAVSLQESEPEDILSDLHIVKERLLSFGMVWPGNLSTAFALIKKKPESITAFDGTLFSDIIRHFIVTYHRIFDLKVPKGHLLPHRFVYRGYGETNHRRNETSLLCKFIAVKFMIGEDADPTGLLQLKKREDILAEVNITQITAMWLGVYQSHHFVDAEFADFIWQYNFYNLPFFVKPSSLKKEIQSFKRMKLEARMRLLSSYYDSFKKIDLLLYFNKSVAEVMMGFIARQQYLFEKVIEQEQRHEGEIAESTLRLLYESRLKFLWMITKQDVDAIRQYREYRAGRENLFVEHAREQTEQYPEFAHIYKELREGLHEVMKEEGVEDYLLGTEKGDPFEKNVKSMADDLGEKEQMYYFSIYKRTSDTIHGNWRILEKYHLDRSINPAHNGLLRYSHEKEQFAGFLPSYLALLLSIEMLLKFFELHPDILKKNRRLNRSLLTMKTTTWKSYMVEFGFLKQEG
ncbi:MAG: DUF5677 domain-containing protein [Sediminibacterium sp.]